MPPAKLSLASKVSRVFSRCHGAQIYISDKLFPRFTLSYLMWHQNLFSSQIWLPTVSIKGKIVASLQLTYLVNDFAQHNLSLKWKKMVLIYWEATPSGKTILVAEPAKGITSHSAASKLPTHHGHKLKCLNYQPQANMEYLTNNTNQRRGQIRPADVADHSNGN